MKENTSQQQPRLNFLNKIQYNLIIIICTIILASTKCSSCTSYKCQYSEYLKKNDIKLLSPIEKEYRFKIFKSNLQEIETFNDSHPDINLDLNEFGIITKREFKKTMTNSDFLFTDEQGEKHHINVNDPRNQEVIDQQIYNDNEKTLKAIEKEVKTTSKDNPLMLLEWDIKDADKAVKKELKKVHKFLNEHESSMPNDTELLASDGSKFICSKLYLSILLVR